MTYNEYKVRNGYHFGHGDTRVDGGGSVLLTEEEAAAHVPVRLILVTENVKVHLDDVEGPGGAEADTVDPTPTAAPEGPTDVQEGADMEDYDIPAMAEWEDMDDRVIDALESAGVNPEELATMTDEDLLSISGIGPKSLREIREHYPQA